MQTTFGEQAHNFDFADLAASFIIGANCRVMAFCAYTMSGSLGHESLSRQYHCDRYQAGATIEATVHAATFKDKQLGDA